MAINTRDKLKEYIYAQLGAPLVNVEVHEDQLDFIIDDTIKEFSSFAYDGELVEYIKLDSTGTGEYNISSKVESIQKISKGEGFFFGNSVKDGFVSDAFSELITSAVGDMVGFAIQTSNSQAMMDKFFGNEINYNYNANKKKLYIFENYIGPLLIEADIEYTPDAIDDIFDHVWIKAMCTAQARLIQSTVTGKYDASLVGGSRINYQDMRALAQEEIAQLKEDLQLKYAGPAPILIG